MGIGSPDVRMGPSTIGIDPTTLEHELHGAEPHGVTGAGQHGEAGADEHGLQGCGQQARELPNQGWLEQAHPLVVARLAANTAHAKRARNMGRSFFIERVQTQTR